MTDVQPTEAELLEAMLAEGIDPDISHLDPEEWARRRTARLPDVDELRAELGALDDVTRRRRVHEVIRALGPDTEETRQEYRAAIVGAGYISAGDWRAAMAESKRAAEQADRERMNQQAAEQAQKAAAAMRARSAGLAEKGAILPAPTNPMAVARELVGRHVRHHDDVPTLTWWRGDWYRWRSTHWAPVADSALEQWAYKHTEQAAYEGVDRFGNPFVADWEPTSAKVGNLLHALSRGVLQRDPSHDPDDTAGAIACANGVVDVDTGRLTRHTPRRFNHFAVAFDYDARAQCPEWEKFLSIVFEHDPDLSRLLQQWFGYILSGRTDLQKIASLVGPPRCGKGTVNRILQALIGEQFCCSPEVSKLPTHFGEEGLVGRRLATFSDVRWTSRNASDAVPILLAISGEDARSVPRKNREDWHGKLAVRFMLMSNDTPTFRDASGAMANRLLNIGFRRSFLGQEDTELLGRLVDELPGILRWALDGLRELNQTGRFITPASSKEAAEEIERGTSPEWAFVQATCVPAAGSHEPLDDMFAAYLHWCRGEGIDSTPTKSWFSRNLRSACGHRVPGFDIARPMVDGVREQRVLGLQIRPEIRAQMYLNRP